MFLDNLGDALNLFLAWESFLAVFVGVFIGIVIGAIPGMTTPMAVALVLPFTFAMSPVTGILLLLGVYKGGLYGGSITAILIKTPGTPAAACTVLDGYPMAQRGEARRALDMALYASVFADFMSNVALILLAGTLASFALKFGPPEFFTLIVFSLTIIAGVSGDRMIMGLVSACMGLLLATIGLDIIYGSERFVFGEVELMSGLNFIPVLIGLFAIPELINHFASPPSKKGEASALGNTGATFADFKRSFPSILRGSIIGVILGSIPGIGGAPAAFLSYSEARRTSKHPETYGKGEIDGIAAAEAGNNGVAGATMIPLLALGIPGDVITAVILGAFMVHDLKPGPLMFQQNIDMIYAIFMGIMLSSVFMFILGKLAIRSLSRISDIPNRLLYPAVLVLCVYGAYAVNNSMFDVLVMMVCGLLGFAMLRFAIPTAPFLIAFVLGALLEDSFRQSMRISDGNTEIFFRSLICWAFWALTVVTVFLLYRAHKKSIPLA